jgi:hypothetical protein
MVYVFCDITRLVVRGKSTDVSEVYIAFVLKAEEKVKQETSRRRRQAELTDFVPSLFFNPEDGSDMFLQHVH